MLEPKTPITIGTNRYEGGKILNALVIGQALVMVAVYNGAFRRAPLTPISCALFSIALVTAEFAALNGTSYLYKQRKIYYPTAVGLSGVAYLLPKAIVVTVLVYYKIMSPLVGISAVGCLVPGITRQVNNALWLHQFHHHFNP